MVDNGRAERRSRQEARRGDGQEVRDFQLRQQFDLFQDGGEQDVRRCLEKCVSDTLEVVAGPPLDEGGPGPEKAEREVSGDTRRVTTNAWKASLTYQSRRSMAYNHTAPRWRRR